MDQRIAIGQKTKGGMMDSLTRISQKPEKPSRLQLAILEWQRQLVLTRTRDLSLRSRPTPKRRPAPVSLSP